jgi:hypothetical protein
MEDVSLPEGPREFHRDSGTPLGSNAFLELPVNVIEE